MKNDNEKLIQFPTHEIGSEESVDIIGAVETRERARSALNRQSRQKDQRSRAAQFRKIIEGNSGEDEIRKVVGDSPAMIKALLPSDKALDHPIYLLEDAVKTLREARPKMKRAIRATGVSGLSKLEKQKLRKQLARTLKLVWEIRRVIYDFSRI